MATNAENAFTTWSALELGVTASPALPTHDCYDLCSGLALEPSVLSIISITATDCCVRKIKGLEKTKR